jgi:hypothetical protein
LCKGCGYQFVHRYRSKVWQDQLFQDYVFGKQTLKQLAEKHGRSIKTIQKYLDQRSTAQNNGMKAQPVVIGLDCCFFGRGYGIIVARCPSLKKNLYWKEITTESKAVYTEARRYLEQNGFKILAVVIDAKYGIKEVFADLIVQICQYHQQQIVQRYLTTRPKTPAGQELKIIADSLTYLDNNSFSGILEEWHKQWRSLLAEKTYSVDGDHWWYTHRRLRAAYRSLHTNLPYLFEYRQHTDLQIPNTNNSLEGFFSKLKQLLNNHHGLKQWRRYKLIETVLNS